MSELRPPPPVPDFDFNSELREGLPTWIRVLCAVVVAILWGWLLWQLATGGH
jgi:hypothetical protein